MVLRYAVEMQNKYFPLTLTTLVNMLGGNLQQLSNTSLDILKLLNITTFKNSCYILTKN